jgi:hypothetical protein
MIKTVLLILFPFLVACTDNDTINSTVETSTEEVVRSQAIAGDAMPMNYRLINDAAIGQPLELSIDFQFDQQQRLELIFNDSDRYSWLEELPAVYTSNAEGKVTVKISIVPNQAGKIYVKFLAATLDDKRVRAFSIPVLVKDETGIVPSRVKRVSDRISLPSSSK